jgi:hypothetical protein
VLVPLAVQGMAPVQGMGVANVIVIFMAINASFIIRSVWKKVIVTMVVAALLQFAYAPRVFMDQPVIYF